MKTYRIFGFEFKWCFSICRIKQYTYSIPEWADDIMIDNESKTPIIKYYKGTKRFYIPLPPCKEARIVKLTPYSKWVEGEVVYFKDRFVTVEIFK
jgi:hypothetical protein